MHEPARPHSLMQVSVQKHAEWQKYSLKLFGISNADLYLLIYIRQDPEQLNRNANGIQQEKSSFKAEKLSAYFYHKSALEN